MVPHLWEEQRRSRLQKRRLPLRALAFLTQIGTVPAAHGVRVCRVRLWVPDSCTGVSMRFHECYMFIPFCTYMWAMFLECFGYMLVAV